MDKKDLSERDICTKYITPALKQAGWDIHSQIREEVTLTAGRVIVKGQMGLRAKGKRADYVLYHKPNMPLAVVEAKDNKHSIGAGIQQAQGYADLLDVPFVFSSNGDGFLFHDRTGLFVQKEQDLSNKQFPDPDELWDKYQQWKGYKPEEAKIISQDYYEDGSGKSPRYYQIHAINKTIEAVARGQNRAILVMARVQEKPIQHFKLSGVYGKPVLKSAFCFWRIEIYWLIKPKQTILSPLAPL